VAREGLDWRHKGGFPSLWPTGGKGPRVRAQKVFAASHEGGGSLNVLHEGRERGNIRKGLGWNRRGMSNIAHLSPCAPFGGQGDTVHRVGRKSADRKTEGGGTVTEG